MTLPLFSAALDTAAVGAMVSVVGTYALDALRDSESRAHHKQQCADRLKLDDRVQVPYSDQAILANLDWGINSLEEAIATSNEETTVARLDHAEKMLQVCALLDGRAATAGVPNSYLSAWAHFNLAFVWKLRNNDRKVANHMLEMFLVDPFFSRVDFAPALWEHLFLPHLSNIVNWYTKQRKSIVVSGTVRRLGEEQDTSFDSSRECFSNAVNVLDLSARQTSQLQALEKLYQDSLDENTKQYARYYKDWLLYDSVNRKGLPLMPIAEPPMTPAPESWVPPTSLPTDQVPSANGSGMRMAEPILLGQVTGSSKSFSRDSSAFPPLTEFKVFDMPESVEMVEHATYVGNGLDDDPDSPHSNFRKPGTGFQVSQPKTTSSHQFESVEQMSMLPRTDQNTPLSPKLLRSTAVRHSDLGRSYLTSSAITQLPTNDNREIPSVPDYEEIESAPNLEENLSVPSSGDVRLALKSGQIWPESALERPSEMLVKKAPRRRKSFRQHLDPLDAPAADVTTTVDAKLSELRDKCSPPKMSHDSPGGITDLRASNNSSSSRHSVAGSSDSQLGSRRAESERNEVSDSDLSRHSSRHKSEGFNQNGNVTQRESSEGLLHSSGASTAIPELVESSDEHSLGASTITTEVVDSCNEYSLRASITIPGDADSSYDWSDSEASAAPQTEELKWEPRQKSSRDADLGVRVDGKASIARTRFLGLRRSSPTSRRYQKDDDGPIVARSEPLLGRAFERFCNEDDEPIAAHSRSSLGRASEGCQDHDDESILAGFGRLPWTHSLGSGSGGGNQGRSRRYGRSESLGSIRNLTVSTSLTKPPKDFVCPITDQLFIDPVTLETGQTYEHIAIQEWLSRGNATCPITRQVLRQNHLPKTNYVLKKLVDAWREQYPDLAKDFGSSPLPGDASATVKASSEFTDTSVTCAFRDSPGSGSRRTSRRFSRQNLVNNNVNDTPPADSPVDVDGLITYLCTSENLAECESIMVEIARLILQARGDQRLVSFLNKAGAIAGMMEILFNSQATRVLNATLFLLSVVTANDETARRTVINADPEAGCLVGLLRRGLNSSASVLYELKLPNDQIASLDLLPLLVVVIKESEENQGLDFGNDQQDIHSMMVRPKAAAIMLLDQIIKGEAQTNAQALLALQAVPALLESLDQSEDIDVQTSAVSLLLCCIKADGRSRNIISKTTNLATIVDLLHNGNNNAGAVAINFLNEVVHLSRRAQCTDVLTKLKAEGSLSSMHVLLVYLQMAPLEHRPVAASLLLQLDLLDEPRKGSIYREEAVECLVGALNSTDWPCPVEAAKTLIALGGRFSYSGKPMMKAWLLKVAGVDKYFLSMIKTEQESHGKDSSFDQEEEGRAAIAWERKVAGALVGHDLGTLIESLEQGIQSKNSEVSKPCMIVATWLTHMLTKLPDTGIRQTARNCFLDHFVVVLQTSKDLQQRVLAALAIHSFISDPDGVKELTSYVKDISGPLRQLRKSTWTAKEILRALTIHGDANSADLWMHAEQGQLDVTGNGDVRALVKAKTRIFSGHSDGSIKIWDATKRFPMLLQDLKEHTKSVMALTVSLNSNRMYSGSLDKSIRVWALGGEEIRCVHVFELKDAVVGLLVNGPMACIIPPGAGLKVQYEETATKTVNPNKHVKSLAISDGKIFCGCADNSLQELDPLSESVDVIQHGVRTLMGKKPIYATQVFEDCLYVAGAPVEGVAGKIWKLPDRSLVGNMCTSSEVRSMAISEDFIYLGSSSGVIEVWLRKKLFKVATLNSGSKVYCLMLYGDTLYSGHGDGKIRIWTMI